MCNHKGYIMTIHASRIRVMNYTRDVKGLPNTAKLLTILGLESSAFCVFTVPCFETHLTGKPLHIF